MTRYLERAGHLNLSDGSVLRLDFECRRWVASYYVLGRDRLELHAYSAGTFQAMIDLLADWCDAFEASTSLVVGARGSVGSGVAIPAPDQTPQLGEIA